MSVAAFVFNSSTRGKWWLLFRGKRPVTRLIAARSSYSAADALHAMADENGPGAKRISLSSRVSRLFERSRRFKCDGTHTHRVIYRDQAFFCRGLVYVIQCERYSIVSETSLWLFFIFPTSLFTTSIYLSVLILQRPWESRDDTGDVKRIQNESS